MSSVSPPVQQSTADPKNDAKTSDWIGGVLLSLLLPIVGLIIGVWYATKAGTKRQVGFTCIGISVAMILMWTVVTSM
jgi:hypothetical protein